MSSVDVMRSGDLGRFEALLVARFSPPLRPEDVERCLFECAAEFHDARVHTYLPVLIEKAAVERLRTAVDRLADAGRSASAGEPCRRASALDGRTRIGAS